VAKSLTARAVARLHDGDTRPCPFCRGLMFFQSKPRDTEAGWFCSCGYRILSLSVAESSTVDVRRELTERRVKAFRESMRVRAHAHRLLKKSDRIAAHPRGKH